MALPSSAPTVLCELSKPLMADGTVGEIISASLEIDRIVIWVQSGETIYSDPVTVFPENDGVLRFPVVPVNVDGMIDIVGNAVTNWRYTLRVNLLLADEQSKVVVYDFQPREDGTFDLDLNPQNGSSLPPVFVDGQKVTINNIVVNSDPEEFERLFDTLLPEKMSDPEDPIGGTLYAAIDQQVPGIVAGQIADANPAIAQAAADFAAQGIGVVTGASQAVDADDTVAALTTPASADGYARVLLGWQADGHLDADSARILRQRLIDATVIDHPDYAYALVTSTGALLFGIKWDGIIEAPGLNVDATFRPLDYHFVDGTYVPTKSDMTKASIWGSSSAGGLSPYLAGMYAGVGVTYTQQGTGGEYIEHTAARHGSIPAEFTAHGDVIAATGDTWLLTTDLPSSTLRAYTATLAGVEGTLSRVASGGTTEWKFTRTTPGDEVPLTIPAPAIPILGPQYRDGHSLLWVGKNNLTSSLEEWNSAEHVADLTNRMFEWLSPEHPRTLVLGHFANYGSKGTPAYDRVLRCNALLAARYGDLYLDVEGLLSSPEVWDYAGVTPTSGDLTAQANRTIPMSLANDSGHLNAAGYIVVRDHLVKPRLNALNYFGGNLS